MIKDIDMKQFCKELSKMDSMRAAANSLTGVLKLQDEKDAWLIKYEDGEIINVNLVGIDEECDMFISMSEEEWREMLRKYPEPQHNIFYKYAKMDDSITQIQYREYINEMIICLRRFYNKEDMTYKKPDPKLPAIRKDAVTGHYIYLVIDGIEYRVYYEESGKGVPMLLHHTAGADGRQFRFLMNDDEFTKDFRFIAPDLPYHGKSLPPFDYPWWEEDYNLTLDFLIKFYKAFIEALGLERPAYMGCSTGGQLAPDLAYYMNDTFRACVGIGSGLCGVSDNEAGKAYLKMIKKMYNNPQVGNVAIAGQMEASVPVIASDNARREVGWVYAQSGPGIYAGDNYYYIVDHDLTDKAQDIDTSKCMLILMTGRYDPGNTPESTKKLADMVQGSIFIDMGDLAHFSITETYPEFKVYFRQVVPKILSMK